MGIFNPNPLFTVASVPDCEGYLRLVMDILGDSLRDPQRVELPAVHRRQGNLTWKQNGRLWAIRGKRGAQIRWLYPLCRGHHHWARRACGLGQLRFAGAMRCTRDHRRGRMTARSGGGAMPGETAACEKIASNGMRRQAAARFHALSECRMVSGVKGDGTLPPGDGPPWLALGGWAAWPYGRRSSIACGGQSVISFRGACGRLRDIFW